MSIIILHIFSLIITILIEFIVIWFFIKKNIPQLFLYTILINSFTLPIATYVYQNILSNFLFIEIIVVFLESFLIMWLLEIKYIKALLVSFVANLLTSMISLLFFI